MFQKQHSQPQERKPIWAACFASEEGCTALNFLLLGKIKESAYLLNHGISPSQVSIVFCFMWDCGTQCNRSG